MWLPHFQTESEFTEVPVPARHEAGTCRRPCPRASGCGRRLSRLAQGPGGSGRGGTWPGPGGQLCIIYLDLST